MKSCYPYLDSRSRHEHNTEKERSRHAQELVRVERVHNKQITELSTQMTGLLTSTTTGLQENLKEARDIKKWLEFETAVLHQQIKDIHQSAQK